MAPFLARVALYPNPSAGNIELIVDVAQGTAVAYSVFDMMGKKVHSGSFTSELFTQQQLNLTHLSSGAYILKVQA